MGLHRPDSQPEFPLPRRTAYPPFYAKCDVLQLLLLFLFVHSTKSSIVQEECLATSAYLATRLHLPQAIEVGLHVRKINVVILTPETAGTVDVWTVAYPYR